MLLNSFHLSSGTWQLHGISLLGHYLMLDPISKPRLSWVSLITEWPIKLGEFWAEASHQPSLDQH